MPLTGNTVDVSEIIERQKLGRFLIGLAIISWIITFFDGLDSNLITFAAPYFGSEYHLSTIQTRQHLRHGSIGHADRRFRLGYLGDRIGRRPTVILATAAFGALTMCFLLHQQLRTLFWLRLIDGIAAGRHAAAGLGAEYRIRAQALPRHHRDRDHGGLLARHGAGRTVRESG